jgi:hypothetical protein
VARSAGLRTDERWRGFARRREAVACSGTSSQNARQSQRRSSLESHSRQNSLFTRISTMFSVVEKPFPMVSRDLVQM